MISFNELLGRHLITDVPINIQQNMQDLLLRINAIRQCWGQPMIVTSGYRDMKDQMRINPSAPNSQHLQGRAVDISDPDGALAVWTKANLDICQAVGLWVEDFAHTPNWVHYQSIAPHSGNRVFIP